VRTPPNSHHYAGLDPDGAHSHPERWTPAPFAPRKSSGGSTQLTDVALATCAFLPDLDDDERLLIPALAALGLIAEPRIWDDPSIDWNDFRVVIVRSTWDYPDRRDAFLDWCGRPRKLLNPAAVIEWNTDKRYLRELAGAGIPVVPTTWIDPGRAPIEMPDGQVVVKPSVSAGARNTSRYRPGDGALARSHIDRLLAEGRTVLLQPYVASVDAAGETGLIYIDGVLSHAIRKGPVLRAPGVATDSLWAPEEISLRVPDAAERAIAEATLDSLPWPRAELLYARVDLVRGDDGRPMLLELELAEPSLFLGFGDGAPERVAAGIARRLGSVT
jgi:glutathione synthase/RimK-type ligase-like ATP-grasp enzyme